MNLSTGPAVSALLESVARALEVFGVLIIAVGVAAATIQFALAFWHGSRKDAYNGYRANLGRGILLGLEVLVGADIIATVTATITWNSVGLLGVIVLIRTFLSFSLETEIEGHWPWQRSRHAGTNENAR